MTFACVAAPASGQDDESADDLTGPPVVVATPTAIDTDTLLDEAVRPTGATTTDAAVSPEATPTTTPTKAVDGLRGSLDALSLRSVVRPVPPSQTTKLAAVAASLPTVDREGDARAEYEPLGLKLGTFSVNATVVSGFGLRRHSRDGSEIFAKTSSEITARSDWERNSVDMTLRGAYRAALSGIDEQLPEGDATLSGRFDVTESDRVSAAAGWTLRDDDGKVNTFSGTLGYERFGGLIGLKTGLGVDRTVHDVDASLDNTAVSASLRLSLDSGATLAPFVEVGAFTRRFDTVAAGDGLRRSGVGGEAKAGVSVDTGDLLGEVAIGYGYEQLDERRLDAISGLIGSASLTWDASELVRLAMLGTTSFEPSSDAGAAGVVKHSGDVTVTYALAPNAFVASGAGVSFEDYVGISRQVTTTTLKAGIGYKVNRAVEVGLDGTHKMVRSSEAGGSYSDSTLEATLTLRR